MGAPSPKNARSKGPPGRSGSRKVSSFFRRLTISPRSQASEALEVPGGILRPRQEAADVIRGALYEKNRAWPSYSPFAPPELGAGPWALRHPAHERATDAERPTKKKLGRGEPLGRGAACQGGEISGVWAKFGGFGALPTDLAHLLDLSVARDMGAAPQYGRTRQALRGLT